MEETYSRLDAGFGLMRGASAEKYYTYEQCVKCKRMNSVLWNITHSEELEYAGLNRVVKYKAYNLCLCGHEFRAVDDERINTNFGDDGMKEYRKSFFKSIDYGYNINQSKFKSFRVFDQSGKGETVAIEFSEMLLVFDTGYAAYAPKVIQYVQNYHHDNPEAYIVVIVSYKDKQLGNELVPLVEWFKKKQAKNPSQYQFVIDFPSRLNKNPKYKEYIVDLSSSRATSSRKVTITLSDNYTIYYYFNKPNEENPNRIAMVIAQYANKTDKKNHQVVLTGNQVVDKAMDILKAFSKTEVDLFQVPNNGSFNSQIRKFPLSKSYFMVGTPSTKSYDRSPNERFQREIAQHIKLCNPVAIIFLNVNYLDAKFAVECNVKGPASSTEVISRVSDYNYAYNSNNEYKSLEKQEEERVAKVTKKIMGVVGADDDDDRLSSLSELSALSPLSPFTESLSSLTDSNETDASDADQWDEGNRDDHVPSSAAAMKHQQQEHQHQQLLLQQKQHDKAEELKSLQQALANAKLKPTQVAFEPEKEKEKPAPRKAAAKKTTASDKATSLQQALASAKLKKVSKKDYTDSSSSEDELDKVDVTPKSNRYSNSLYSGKQAAKDDSDSSDDGVVIPKSRVSTVNVPKVRYQY